jgi:hypothetical protein
MTESDERTAQYVELTKQTVRQRLDCLTDSGAKFAEIEAVAKLFSDAVEVAFREAVGDLIRQLEEDEDDES